MFKSIFLALTIGLLPLSSTAFALGDCDGIENEKKRAKCEKKAAKAMATWRAESRPYKPSKLGEAFAGLNGAENPFNSDAYYLGVKKTGIKKLDRFNNKVNRVVATLRMAQYIGELNQTNPEQAGQLGAAILPLLIGLKDEAPKIAKRGKKLAADPASLLENPMQMGRAVSSLKNSVQNLGSVLADLPSVIQAIEPIAKGAAGGLVGAALDQAGEALGTVGQAADAIEGAKSTIEEVQATAEKTVEAAQDGAIKTENTAAEVNPAREAAKVRARQLAEEAKKAAAEEAKD